MAAASCGDFMDDNVFEEQPIQNTEYTNVGADYYTGNEFDNTPTTIASPSQPKIQSSYGNRSSPVTSNTEAPITSSQKWLTKDIPFEFSGSLHGLSSGEKSYIELSPLTISKMVGQNTPLPISSPSDKKTSLLPVTATSQPSTKVIVSKIDLISLRNDMKCALLFSVGGVKGDKKNVITAEGLLGNYVAYPGVKFQEGENTSITLMNAPEHSNNKFIDQFPGWNIDNIHEGCSAMPDGASFWVVEDHPIISMVDNAMVRQRQRKISETEKNSGSFQVESKMFHTIQEALKNGMIEKLPVTDLKDFRLSFSRAFVSETVTEKGIQSNASSWVDAREIKNNGFDNPKMETKFDTTVRSVYGTLRVHYSLT